MIDILVINKDSTVESRQLDDSDDSTALAELQRLVGGYVEPHYFEEFALLGHEEEKVLVQSAPPNILIDTFVTALGWQGHLVGDYMAGAFVMTGPLVDGRFTSLSERWRESITRIANQLPPLPTDD